jgi:hypothetical protein
VSRTLEDYDAPVFTYETRVKYGGVVFKAKDTEAAKAAGFCWWASEGALVHIRARIQPSLCVQVGLPSAFSDVDADVDPRQRVTRGGQALRL